MAGMYLYGESIPFHNNILMYRHGFHSVKLGIVHSSPLWYPQRKTMVKCGRYRQVSGIGNLWKCSGVKLWTIPQRARGKNVEVEKVGEVVLQGIRHNYAQAK